MLVLASGLIVIGGVICWSGMRVRRGRLRRNHAVGIITAASMSSETAFQAANRAAAPTTVAGGVVVVAVGVLVPLLGRFDRVLAAIGVAVAACLALSVFGYRRGQRHARRAEAAASGDS